MTYLGDWRVYQTGGLLSGPLHPSREVAKGEGNTYRNEKSKGNAAKTIRLPPVRRTVAGADAVVVESSRCPGGRYRSFQRRLELPPVALVIKR